MDDEQGYPHDFSETSKFHQISPSQNHVAKTGATNRRATQQGTTAGDSPRIPGPWAVTPRNLGSTDLQSQKRFLVGG